MRRHRLVGRCVLVDQPVGDQAAAAEGDDQQQHDDHELRAVLVLARILEEPVHHLAEGVAERVDGLVGVVDGRERVVGRHAVPRDRALPVGVRPRVDRDGVAREQQRRDEEHVAGGEVQLQVAGVEPVERAGDQAEHDHDAPGEPDGCHDGSAPRHEAASAARVLRLDPGLADLDSVEDRDRQVQKPDEHQDEQHSASPP